MLRVGDKEGPISVKAFDRKDGTFAISDHDETKPYIWKSGECVEGIFWYGPVSAPFVPDEILNYRKELRKSDRRKLSTCKSRKILLILLSSYV